VMGRRLGLPATSIAPADALEHFGYMALYAGVDGPATASVTQELLGWEPTGPTLLADLEGDHYYRRAPRPS
jgi:hypothetical protein